MSLRQPKQMMTIHKTICKLAYSNYLIFSKKEKKVNQFMEYKECISFPYLLTREQASNFLGIDPKSFDRYVRPHKDLQRFMIGRQERYTTKSLVQFIEKNSI